MSKLKASKYQAYPEYRKVASEWLSKIPQSWTISTLKHVARINMGQSPSSEDCNIEGIGIPFLQGNAEFGIKTPLEKQYCPKPRKIAQEGELLFSVRAPVGALNFANKSFGIGRGLCSIQGNDSVSQSFLWWVLPSYKYQFDAIATGSTFEAISAEQVGNLSFALPNSEEQTQIANFLDHETAKIDTLIEKQQQLIKLLKEKRQAVISHAVTKGIPNKEHPNVAMKDSGVEWLGEVPAHWNVLALRRVILSMEQGKSPECESTPALYNQWGVLKTSCVNNGIFHARENKALPSNIQPHKKYEVKAGDILMSRASGSIKLIGSVAIVQTGVRERLLLSDKVFRIHLSTNVLNTYFSYLMATPYMRTLVERAISGAEGMANNITKSSIMEFTGVFPPVNEQISIVEYISSQCERFDKLIFKAEKGSNLLKERRIALISAAVTGKIDVRNWEQPND